MGLEQGEPREIRGIRCYPRSISKDDRAHFIFDAGIDAIAGYIKNTAGVRNEERLAAVARCEAAIGLMGFLYPVDRTGKRIYGLRRDQVTSELSESVEVWKMIMYAEGLRRGKFTQTDVDEAEVYRRDITINTEILDYESRKILQGAEEFHNKRNRTN